MHKSAIILCVALLSGCQKSFSNNITSPTSNVNKFENQTSSEIQQEITTNDDFDQTTVVNVRHEKKRMTIEELCDNVVNSLQNKDSGQLKDLFCNRIATTHNLDNELSSFFNFIDGDFVSFTDYHKDLRYGGEHKNGVYVKQHVGTRIRAAKTDTGQKYKIEFYANLVYDNAPDKIGLEYVVITNSEGEELWIGECVDD